MSRLESNIKRLIAQRDLLNYSKEYITELNGPIFELGLGNGRTYDHLRTLYPQREIFVFDRHIACHPDCIPDEKYMVLGDIKETLRSILLRSKRKAAMAHSDTGSGNAKATKEFALFLGPILETLVEKGGLILSDQEFTNLKIAKPLGLPKNIDNGRYYTYQIPNTA